MTKVVIVGEIFNAGLYPGGGPMPGYGDRPVDPGYSPPWARPGGGGGPVDPGYSPPWARPGGGPVDPGYSPPWARPQPPYPDNSLPGSQPHPDNSLPGQQPGIWGPNDPRPTPPIYIGPPVPAPEPEMPIQWHSAWTPSTGWVTVGIVVPQGPVPTPSAE
jgi:hypothetical protein